MTSITGLSANLLYPIVAKDEQSQVARFQASDPQTKAAIAYFQKQAPKLTSPDALLKDYRSLQVALSAFGMGDAIGYTGLLKKLMTEDPNDPNSVARRTANPKYQRFAQFMSNWNPPPLADAATVNVITGQFATNSFEQSEGQQAPGLQEALYFRRSIAGVTSVQQLMADPTLLQVAVTGSGLPQQFGLMDYDRQVSMLGKSVDLNSFKTQAGIDKFVQKYLAMNQLNAGAADPTGILTLLGGASSGYGGVAGAILSAIA